MVKSPIDVFIEEPEVGCPFVDKEWTRSGAVLAGKSHETRGTVRYLSLTAFHISPSRFKIPEPRKVSLVSLKYIVMRGLRRTHSSSF